MLRIIAGKHRGRRIEIKDGASIRPTGSMVRESLFNILMHGNFSGPDSSPLVDRNVADLFCGTGALGLEALSRGATKVTFVDQSQQSIALARANAAHMGEEGNVHLIRSDSTVLPPARMRHHLVFLDPPYHSGLAGKALLSLDAQGWLEAGAIVVVELAQKEAFEAPEPFTLFDTRHYGNTQIAFLRYGEESGG